MELVYMWIKEYKNIRHQGFNFSPNHEFELTKKEDGEYILEDKIMDGNRKNIPKNFFGENIRNITGIIGKNGSGKSSLLECIFNKLTSLINYDKKWIKIKESDNFILGENKESKFFYKLLNKGVVEKRDEFIAIMKQGKEFYITSNRMFFQVNDKEPKEEKLEYNLINYSNLLDYDYQFTDRVGDISTSYLFNNYHKIYSHLKKDTENLNGFIEGLIRDLDKNPVELKNVLSKLEKSKKKLNFIDGKAKAIGYVRTLDMEKQIDYLLKYKGTKLLEFLKKEINIPNGIDFHLRSPSFFLKENQFGIEKSEPFIKINKIGSNENNETAYKKDIKLKTSFKLIFLLIQETNSATLEEIINNGEVTDTFLNKIIDKYFQNNFQNNSEEIKIMLEALKDLLEKSVYDKLNDKFHISLENGDKFFKFIRKVLQYNTEHTIFSYGWDRNMSTGEKGMFSFFSRLDNLLDNDYSEDKNLIILIDEIEATFHPEWQRKSLDFIRNYLLEYNNENEDSRKINWQLILTSHSPFITSDLPKENVIMLKTYDDEDKETNEKYQKKGNCKVVRNKTLNTFGANIFDLYKESFFLTSTFGEFAKGQIKKVVRLLTPINGEYKEDEIEKNKDEIKYIINSIGEPIIKNRLEKAWKDYCFSKDESSGNRIKRLIEEYNLKPEDLEKFIENNGECYD